MNAHRVVLLYEQSFGGEIDLAIENGFKANGFEVTSVLRGTAWEPRFDMVVGYGPFTYEHGHLLTVAKQLLALPEKERPVFIWWLTENPPPPWISKRAAAFAAKARLWGDACFSELPESRWRSYLMRAHRLRILGQLKWAWEQGCLDVLVVTNRARARYFEAFGMKAVVAPLGYDRHYGADLGIERDIDVSFLGQMNSRRQQILPDLVSDLRARGISVELATNLYGEERTLFLNRSKILLNVLRSHQDFVGQRLSLGAVNGALNVSEPMLDPYPFRAGDHFIDAQVADMADAVERALDDEVTRRRIVREAYRLVTEELTGEKMVQRILVQAQSAWQKRNDLARGSCTSQMAG